MSDSCVYILIARQVRYINVYRYAYRYTDTHKHTGMHVEFKVVGEQSFLARMVIIIYYKSLYEDMILLQFS